MDLRIPQFPDNLNRTRRQDSKLAVLLLWRPQKTRERERAYNRVPVHGQPSPPYEATPHEGD